MVRILCGLVSLFSCGGIALISSSAVVKTTKVGNAHLCQGSDSKLKFTPPLFLVTKGLKYFQTHPIVLPFSALGYYPVQLAPSSIKVRESLRLALMSQFDWLKLGFSDRISYQVTHNCYFISGSLSAGKTSKVMLAYKNWRCEILVRVGNRPSRVYEEVFSSFKGGLTYNARTSYWSSPQCGPKERDCAMYDCMISHYQIKGLIRAMKATGDHYGTNIVDWMCDWAQGFYWYRGYGCFIETIYNGYHYIDSDDVIRSDFKRHMGDLVGFLTRYDQQGWTNSVHIWFYYKYYFWSRDHFGAGAELI